MDAVDARRQRAKAPPLPAGLPVNPPGTLIGEENVVLTGTNNRYFVPEFEGCLSAAMAGSAARRDSVYRPHTSRRAC